MPRGLPNEDRLLALQSLFQRCFQETEWGGASGASPLQGSVGDSGGHSSLSYPTGEKAGTSYTISCQSLAKGFREWGTAIRPLEKVPTWLEVRTAHHKGWRYRWGSSGICCMQEVGPERTQTDRSISNRSRNAVVNG